MSGKSANKSRVAKDLPLDLAYPAPASQQTYRVGPGCPPREHQWRKGQSGNPKGRKPKPSSIEPALKAALERALNSKVTLRQGEREHLISCADAGIRQLVTQFARGDRYARRDLFAYADRLGVNLVGSLGGAADDALASAAHAALDEYLARLTGPKLQSAASPVVASPDLLDDDEETG